MLTPGAWPGSRGAEAVLFGGAAVLCGAAAAVVQAAWLLLALPVVLAGGSVVLRSMDVGLAALAFVVYTNLSDVLLARHGIPSITKALIALLVALAALRWLTGRFRGAVPWVPVALVLAYAGVQAMSALFAEAGDLALQASLDCVKDALIGLIVATLLQRLGGLRLVIWAMLAGGGLIATLSVIQIVTGDYSTDYGGLAKASLHQIVGKVDDYRITGPLDDPNFYAQTLVALVPLAIDRLLGRETPVFRIAAAGVLAVLVTAIVVTYSRGGLLALGCVTLATILFLRPPLRVVVPAALLFLLAVPLVPDSYADRVQTMAGTFGESRGSDSDESLEGRVNEAMAALAMFADHPALGIGPKNYAVSFQRYNTWQHGENRREDREAHSLYLEVMSETGLAGILAFGAILASIARSVLNSVHGFRRAGRIDGVATARSIGIGLAGYGVAAVWLHSSWPQYFWLLAGLAWALPGIARHEVECREAEATGTPHAPAGLPLIRSSSAAIDCGIKDRPA